MKDAHASEPASERRLCDLGGKTAVITGAGTGIGRSIAELFARQGAHVEIVDQDVSRGDETVRAIRDAGHTAGLEVCDVARTALTEQCIRRIQDHHGRIDILVNNAGIIHVGDLLATGEDDLERVFRVNVKGVYNCLRPTVEIMVGQGGGVILNLASAASLMGVKERFAYSMSKGAVLTMTYSVAIDYIDKNIRCNCICPARVHTSLVDGFVSQHYADRREEMFKQLSTYQPIGRMAQPEEVAALALFLCSDEASFVTGCAYPLDGGLVNLR